MLAKLEVYYDGEYWCARGIGADVFTQGSTLDELMSNIQEAASLHFEDVLERGENLHLLILSEMEIEGAASIAAS
jgi:predicted RNase H-like HicB family nuclease